MRSGPRYTRAMEAVDQHAQFGSWTVLRRSDQDGCCVIAVCGGCGQEQEIDIHDLRRSRRRSLGGSTSCKGCANRMKRGTFARLPVGESLLNTFECDYRKAATIRGLSFDLSREVFRALVFAVCTYCGQPPTQQRSSNWDTILVNGIDRVDASVGYIESNCVTCCKTCNYMKRLMSRDEFLDHVRKIVEHSK